MIFDDYYFCSLPGFDPHIKSMKKPLFTLKRTFSTIIISIYACLLIVMVVFLLVQNKRNNETEDYYYTSAVQRYISSVTHIIDKMNNMADEYLNNTYFQTLSRSASAHSDNEAAYYLNVSLSDRFLLEQELHGYILYFSEDYDSRYYYVDNVQVKDEALRYLKNKIQEMLPDLYRAHTVTIIPYDTENYFLTLITKRNHASVVFIFNLKSADNVLSSDLQNRADCYTVYEGKCLNTEYEAVENLPALNPYEGSAEKIRQGNMVYYGAYFANTDLAVYTVREIPFLGGLNLAVWLLGVLILLAVISFIMIVSFLTYQFIRPLGRLTSDMEKIRQGEIKNIRPMETSFEELNEVSSVLMETIDELEEQKQHSVEEAVRRQRAELQYLRLQLNPHFYINNLKLISALATEGENEKIYDLSFRMSRYLRYLLQNRRETVPLSEEIEFTRNYVELIKTYRRAEMSCEFSVDEEALSVSVPMLLIQTFVENSFKYAKLRQGEVDLKIRISAELLSSEDGKILDIIVRDNGEGYSQEMLAEFDAEDNETEEHIGIRNLIERCRLIYGDRLEYNLRNEDGAVSEVIIPVETGWEESE